MRIGKQRRIGIDGMHGVGKSTISGQLGTVLNLTYVEIDVFLERNKGGFVDFIDYDALKVAIPKNDFIVEGVCLRQVTERLGLDVDLVVYVKRMHLGLWADEDDCVFPNGVDVRLI